MGDVTDPSAVVRAPRTRRYPVIDGRSVLGNVLAGLLVALTSLTFTVSHAALIFSGDLARYLPFGVSSAFLAAVIIGAVVAARSSFRFTIAGPDANASAVAALLAAATAQTVLATGSEAAVLPTVMTAIAGATMAAGFITSLLGRRRLGRLVRYIPYSVIGGFIAGTGWLVVRGAMVILTGVPLGFPHLGTLARAEHVVQWLPGLVIALVVMTTVRRYKHYLVLPALIMGLIGVFYALLWVSGTSLEQARAVGWLFAPYAQAEFFLPWHPTALALVDWGSLLPSAGLGMSLVFIVTVSLLLNASSVEMATGTEADLDRELEGTGMANLLSGAVGGLPGYQSIVRSLLNYRAGATSRLAGFVNAGSMVGMLLAGGLLLSFLPKPVLGGLLLYLGLSLLWEWVYSSWFRLPRLDYVIVVTIVLVIANIGFLPGLGVGFALASLVFVLNYGRLRVVKHEVTGADHRSKLARTAQQERLLVREGRQLRVLFLQGYLFFGSAHALAEHLRQRVVVSDGEKPKLILLNFRLVSGLDTSALYSFSKLKRMAQANGVTLVLTDVAASIEGQLKESGFLKASDPSVVAFADFDHGLEWCENEILKSVALRRTRFVPLALLLEDFFGAPVDVARFMGYLEPMVVQAGEMVYATGAEAEALYFIETGRVTLGVKRADGQEVRLQTLGSGQVFGEASLYEAGTTADAVTEERTKLYRLTREALARMQRDDPPLAIALYRGIGRVQNQRLLRANRELQLLLHGAAE